MLFLTFSFIPNLLRKLFTSNFQTFFFLTIFFRPTQSRFRPSHSTKACLLKISNDAFLASNSGKLSLLFSLDFSSAFDTVDHSLLLQHLNCSFGILASLFSGLLPTFLIVFPLFLLTTLFLLSSLCSFWCSSKICLRTSFICFFYLSSFLSHRIFPKSVFRRLYLHLLSLSFFFPFFSLIEK